MLFYAPFFVGVIDFSKRYRRHAGTGGLGETPPGTLIQGDDRSVRVEARPLRALPPTHLPPVRRRGCVKKGQNVYRKTPLKSVNIFYTTPASQVKCPLCFRCPTTTQKILQCVSTGVRIFYTPVDLRKNGKESGRVSPKLGVLARG